MAWAVAALAVCLAVSIVLLAVISAKLTRERRENDQLRRALMIGSKNLEGVKHTLVVLREVRHDLRQFLRAAEQLDKSVLSEVPALRSVLEKRAFLGSESIVISSLVEHFREQLEASGADADIRIEISDCPEEFVPDLCLILSNLLENALEAVSREGGGWVRARATTAEGWISLVIGNSSATQLRETEEGFLSSKASGRLGLGLSCVKTIARQQGGKAEFSGDGEMFKASVFLPWSAAADKAECPSGEKALETAGVK